MLTVVIVVAVMATSSNDTALQHIQQDINDKVATLKRHVSSSKDPSITDAGKKTCEKGISALRDSIRAGRESLKALLCKFHMLVVSFD